VDNAGDAEIVCYVRLIPLGMTAVQESNAPNESFRQKLTDPHIAAPLPQQQPVQIRHTRHAIEAII